MTADMREFWEDRAQENALYFIDNQLSYEHPEAERFFEHGERELQVILDRLELRIGPEDRVVEIGCGAGRVTRAIAERARHVRAVDISERMLRVARELHPDLDNVEWLLGDGVSLAVIDDGSADVCFSHVVFQHIPDPAVTLGYVREMGRVLRAGGWAAFQISNDRRVHRPRRGLERLRLRIRALLGRGPKGQEHPAWLGSAVDLDDLRASAEAAGMEVKRVVGEGTQFCFVRLHRLEDDRSRPGASADQLH